MIYSIVLVSAIQQHKPIIAIYIYIYLPSLWSLPPTAPPSRPLGHHRAPGWAPCVISNFPLATLSTHGRVYMTFPGGSVVKNLSTDAGDVGSIPESISGLGRSPGRGNGNPFHYSCLENPIDGEAWRPTVHRIAESQTRQVTGHAQRTRIYTNAAFSMRPPLSFPCCIHKPILYICVSSPSPQTGSSVPLFWIPYKNSYSCFCTS